MNDITILQLLLVVCLFKVGFHFDIWQDIKCCASLTLLYLKYTFRNGLKMIKISVNYGNVNGRIVLFNDLTHFK